MTEEETEKAVIRHQRRYKVFLEEGLCEEQAWDLADQMWNRDADPHDDRRVCFECEKYMGGFCLGYLKDSRPTRPLRFILQRCDKFKLKKKKAYETLSRD